MPPKTKTLLDENRIYVSWGILIIVVVITLMIGRMMEQLNNLSPIITEVQNLKLEFVGLKETVNNLKAEVINSTNDLNNIRSQLHLYNVETTKF